MRTRFKRGNTQENNSMALLPGELSVDIQKKAVRVHDGITPGGFEVVGVRAFTPAAELLAGDDQLGWYGELSSAQFITASALAAEVGLSAGTVINDEATWLKFAHLGKTLFIPKQPLIGILSWQELADLALVYGDTEITIAGQRYKVRLMTGGDADPAAASGGEWNALFYPISADARVNTLQWASYTLAELNDSETARYTWCQEVSTSSTTHRVQRGGGDITIRYANTYTANGSSFWRPVLELIP
jgi:hypothetical protein